jgi:hypothetical protein
MGLTATRNKYNVVDSQNGFQLNQGQQGDHVVDTVQKASSVTGAAVCYWFNPAVYTESEDTFLLTFVAVPARIAG